MVLLQAQSLAFDVMFNCWAPVPELVVATRTFVACSAATGHLRSEPHHFPSDLRNLRHDWIRRHVQLLGQGVDSKSDSAPCPGTLASVFTFPLPDYPAASLLYTHAPADERANRNPRSLNHMHTHSRTNNWAPAAAIYVPPTTSEAFNPSTHMPTRTRFRGRRPQLLQLRPHRAHKSAVRHPSIRPSVRQSRCPHKPFRQGLRQNNQPPFVYMTQC